MTKKDLEKRIKELEIENKFLWLQLENIAELGNGFVQASCDEKLVKYAKMDYVATHAGERLEYIRDYNLPYNLFNKNNKGE